MIKQSNAILFILIFSLILATSPIQASENDSTEFYIETYMTNSTEIIIADINTLEENCDVSGNTWTLRAGKYSIPSTASTISIKTKTLVVGDGVSFIIGEDISHADVLLEVDIVILKDKGILNVYGGGINLPPEPGYAYYEYATLNSNYFIQEGGTLVTTGGEAHFAKGIIANKLFTQKSGILTANGGEGYAAFGMHFYQGRQNKGIVNANGGEGFSAFSIVYVNYFLCDRNHGVQNVNDGIGEYSYGIAST